MYPSQPNTNDRPRHHPRSFLKYCVNCSYAATDTQKHFVSLLTTTFIKSIIPSPPPKNQSSHHHHWHNNPQYPPSTYQRLYSDYPDST
mmetsp:Transcript_6615/g.10826  ORF Transcript_6615/g.10826 Transcript_6615/m.10826 type:complete len:88 (+) Transcript_6615:242-505(+)